MGHRVSKLRDVIDLIKAYNFYLECFSLRRQTRGQVRSTVWQNLKNHNSLCTERRGLKFRPDIDFGQHYNFYLRCFSPEGKTKGQWK